MPDPHTMRNQCPLCRAVLTSVVEVEFVTWHCPDGHGLGCTTQNARGHLQLDELQALMEAGRTGAIALDYRSPSLGMPMKVAEIIADDDEIIGNVGPNARPVTGYLAADEGFLWFSYDEFAKLPPAHGRNFAGVLSARQFA